MILPFTKASACGNDFLIVDGDESLPDLADLTRRICDRHNGVGADGVEWLFLAHDADVEARLINADGSAAEISGNGTRCVAAYLSAESRKELVVIRTGAGLKTCKLVARNGVIFEFETAMGTPEAGNSRTVRTTDGEVTGTLVSMGNPHFVVVVDQFWADWPRRAAEIQADRSFKQGVNVELVRIENRSHIETRFFERGVGETMSSGTGSCAAAVAMMASGRADSPVRVRAAGGTQTVRWDKELFLTGPAHLVCEGKFFL
jgi:diaminopimelate epimerase